MNTNKLGKSRRKAAPCIRKRKQYSTMVVKMIVYAFTCIDFVVLGKLRKIKIDYTYFYVMRNTKLKIKSNMYVIHSDVS